MFQLVTATGTKVGTTVTMLRNYYTIAFRFLAKSKIYTTIHVVGLVVGFTSFILISLYVTDELTYDNFTNSDRLFRIVNTAPENNPWLKGMPQTPVQVAAVSCVFEMTSGIVNGYLKIFKATI
jgi:hypothetical protein